MTSRIVQVEVRAKQSLQLARDGLDLMGSEIQRHLRQIRALQDALRQQRGGGGNTGSAVLDCVCEHVMVPYLKDTRPAWKGLRIFNLDDELEHDGDAWNEIEWWATLYRVRTTCRAARRFHDEGGAVDTYLRESKSRHAAMRMWSTLYRQRARYMRDRLGLEWGDDRRMMPQRCIDETWESVEASTRGLRLMVDDGSLGEL
jgi:hypothetical protein